MKHLKELRKKRKEGKSRSQASTGEEVEQQPEGQGPHHFRAASIDGPSSSDKHEETKDLNPKVNELMAALPEECQRAVQAQIEFLNNKYLSPSCSVLYRIIDKFPSDYVPIERTIFDQRFIQLFGLSDPYFSSNSKTNADSNATGFKTCKPEEFTVLFRFPIRPAHDEVKRMKIDTRRVYNHFSGYNHTDGNSNGLVKLVIQALYYQFKLEQRQLHIGVNGFTQISGSRKERAEELEELARPFWQVIETKMGIPRKRLESAKSWAEAYEKYREDTLNYRI